LPNNLSSKAASFSGPRDRAPINRRAENSEKQSYERQLGSAKFFRCSANAQPIRSAKTRLSLGWLRSQSNASGSPAPGTGDKPPSHLFFAPGKIEQNRQHRLSLYGYLIRDARHPSPGLDVEMAAPDALAK
jgi:hypothetical protein